jgi:3-oxoacyl-[acyl-carrier-protein] synthase II
MKRRVVITGMGAVTPLAVGVEESWKKLCKGESGIKNVSLFDASSLKCQVAGEARGFSATEFMSPKKIRRTDDRSICPFSFSIRKNGHGGQPTGYFRGRRI